MLKRTTFGGATGAAVALLASLAGPAHAQDTELTGTPALSGEVAGVTGVLSVYEIGPLERSLELALTDAQTGEPITGFDVELTQELHIIATDSAFSTFIHVHDESAEPNGHFQVDMTFPKPGLYHIYADAVPTGLGQQVLRFDLEVGADQAAGADQQASTTSPEPQSGDVLSSAGPYDVQLDISDLRAGEDSAVTLEILEGGHPAEDLAPYLGVPAHAVFIGTDDLAYVHAHATPAEGGEGHSHGGQGMNMDMPMADTEAAASHGTEDHAAHSGHGTEAMEPAATAAEHGSEAHGHGEHGAAGTEAEVAVPASLLLHVTPPAPGTYALWIQFMGDGEVRTAPFVISVQ